MKNMKNTVLIYESSTFYIKGAINAGLVRRYATSPTRGVKVYLELQENKSVIYKENKDKSGIYC
jgi:hypothetical protein